MPSYQRLLFPLLLMGAALLPAIGGASEPARKLVIAADAWCPINCEEKAEHPGIGIDLAREAFEPLGYTVEYTIMPWSRALEAVRSGEIDAVVGANYHDDGSLVFPQEPIYRMTDDIYVRSDDTRSMQLEALQERQIGYISGYGYGEPMQRFLKHTNHVQAVNGVDALEQNLRKLHGNRIDALVESRAIMEYTLAGREERGWIRHVASMPQGNVYVAFSPAHPEARTHARQFDEAVARLRASGTLDTLYARYRLSPQ